MLVLLAEADSAVRCALATALAAEGMLVDDPDLQVIATFGLRRGAFELEICGDGREVLDRTRRFRPDLLLLDVMLPFVDGPSILTELRRRDDVTQPPVIFMTARTLPEEIAEYRKLGCLDVVVKPFDPMTLADSVRDIWRRHHRRIAADEAAELADLKATYVRQLPSKLAALDKLARAARASAKDADVQALFHHVHRLIGSSAMFGFPQISEAAAALEDRLTGSGSAARQPVDWRTLDVLLRDLRHAARPVAGPHASAGRRRPPRRK